MAEKVVGCGKIKPYLAGMDEEWRAQIIQRMRDYPHLYPCPKQDGGWIYKKSCQKCRDAVRKETD